MAAGLRGEWTQPGPGISRPELDDGNVLPDLQGGLAGMNRSSCWTEAGSGQGFSFNLLAQWMEQCSFRRSRKPRAAPTFHRETDSGTARPQPEPRQRMQNHNQSINSTPTSGTPDPLPSPQHGDDYYRVSTEENPIVFDATRSLLDQMEEDAMDGNPSALRFLKEQIYQRPEVFSLLEPGPGTTVPINDLEAGLADFEITDADVAAALLLVPSPPPEAATPAVGPPATEAIPARRGAE